jgi:hypothetical protein
MRQLTLDGREVDHPLRVGQPLSDRQREILRFVRARGVVRSYEVGAMMHAGRDGGLQSRATSPRGAGTWAAARTRRATAATR